MSNQTPSPKPHDPPQTKDGGGLNVAACSAWVSDTPETDAFKERVRSGAHPDYWEFCENLERHRNILCAFINREMRMDANDRRVTELKNILENAKHTHR